MLKYGRLAVSAVICAALLIGPVACGGGGGGDDDDGGVSETPAYDLTGTHAYQTSDPAMTGDCDLLYEILGCGSASSCLLFGTTGQMVVEQSGSDIVMDIKGDAGTEWMRFEGTAGSDSFLTKYNASMQEDGCSFNLEARITGTDIKTSTEFSGLVDADMGLSGSCGGYTLNCTLEANFIADASAGTASLASVPETSVPEAGDTDKPLHGAMQDAAGALLSVR